VTLPGGASTIPLAAFLAVHLLQRVSELVVSARHARALLARGGRESGRTHFPWIVALHALFPLALSAEVLLRPTRPGALAPLWFALWAAAQLVRFASMRALGERWTARVIVLPGVPAVRTGIYRWMRHPNYAAVAVELLAAPLMLGAWWTAVAFTLADAAALAVRIRCEDAALARAEALAPAIGASHQAAGGGSTRLR